MKTETFKKRLRKNRPMTTVSIRMPIDVVDDLKKVAPQLGFSGYQPLLRAYVGQGLRSDLERLEQATIKNFIKGLKKHGVNKKLIDHVFSELHHA